MALILTAVCVVAALLSLTTILWKKTQHESTADDRPTQHFAPELYSLLGLHQDVALFDGRQPLDLLAHT